jgi:hypothetical protein
MTVYEVLTSRRPLFRVPAYSQSVYDRARDGRFHLHEDRPPQALAPPLTSQDIGTSRWQLGLNVTQLGAYPKGSGMSLQGP